MRYSVYKHLRGVSESLIEATTYLLEHKELTSMIVESGNAVLAIKTTLEANKEKVIDEVDTFMEVITKIADSLECGQDYSGELKKLNDLALIINKYCKDEIKYKFKIVFFAELGSKWDSVDSVYRAYKNREDCDVAVVLQPIYRAIRFPNGEVKSDVIYRDYLTEMGIEHILFKDYDIKKDMPDMVLTSQPYESVTSEQFWSENIVPYTRLVYLPYYTAEAIESNEQKAVQCQMPIHQLAWKIVCQSEKQKEQYSKYSPVKGSNLVAFGLPKWDWVTNMEERKIELPKEWSKLKDKKIVLRNLHYSAAGAVFNDERKNNKVINELRIISERYEGSNIGYIYRMHPMTETMFKVYCPQYLEEWEKTKKDIEKSGNVVIDYNETYDCAFKFSDILFSEKSSLVTQYLLTKKPVVMLYWGEENFEKIEEQESAEEYFLKYSDLCHAKSSEEADSIRDNIFENGDYEHEKSIEFIKNYMSSADGHIGERIAEYCIKEMLKEDNIL